MRCLFHRWGPWEDVEKTDKPYPGSCIHRIEVIKQQRRCSRCNRVHTVTS